MAVDIATGDDLITVKVGTILSLKEVLGRREIELLIKRGSTMAELIGSMVDTYGESLSQLIYETSGAQAHEDQSGPSDDAGRDGGTGNQVRSSDSAHPAHGVFPRVRMMVNGRDIEFLGGMGTVLHDGDQVLILPMVAGG